MSLGSQPGRRGVGEQKEGTAGAGEEGLPPADWGLGGWRTEDGVGAGAGTCGCDLERVLRPAGAPSGLRSPWHVLGVPQGLPGGASGPSDRRGRRRAGGRPWASRASSWPGSIRGRRWSRVVTHLQKSALMSQDANSDGQ